MISIPPVGRVVATELKPSTPHQFHFWTAQESPIGIGAIVRVEEGSRLVYGVVTDGFAYSDIVSPMHAVIAADADPVAARSEPTTRAEIRLYTAAGRSPSISRRRASPGARGAAPASSPRVRLARHRRRRCAGSQNGRIHRT